MFGAMKTVRHAKLRLIIVKLAIKPSRKNLLNQNKRRNVFVKMDIMQRQQ